MWVRLLVTACTLLAAGCRFGFDARTQRDDGGGILPPGDGMVNGDAPDSAALFDCKITHPTAMFCDGFEGPMNETWGYEVVMNGRVEATTTRAYRGTRALEVETLGVDNYKSARWGMFLPAAVDTGDLYVRVFYWISSTTTWGEQASILSTGNGNDPFPSTYVMFTPNEMQLNVDSAPFTYSAVDFPRDRWVCMEIHIAVDATNGAVELDFDGTRVATATNADTFVGQEGYTGVDIGLHYATPQQGPVVMWADEVIADTSPIGCN